MNTNVLHNTFNLMLESLEEAVHYAEQVDAILKENKMEKLKLYVWENYGCDYTCGIAFALAESEEEARKLIHESDRFVDERTLSNPPKVFTDKISFGVWGGG